MIMKIPSAALTLLVGAAMAQECMLRESRSAGMVQNLEGLTGVIFKGFVPTVKRVEGDPKLTVLAYGSEPDLEVVDGKLVVSKALCSAKPTTPTPPGLSPAPTDATGSTDPTDTEEPASGAVFSRFPGFIPAVALGIASWFGGSSTHSAVGMGTLLALAIYTPLGHAQQSVDCESMIEVEISGPIRSTGEVWMQEEIDWDDYDDSPDSLHFRPDPVWSDQVRAAREFRDTETGSVAYNYRTKVLMGQSQTRVLNEAPTTTPKDEVVFALPENVILPDTDEGIMMLSVLEMQALLRQGNITATQLTNIALAMLQKYDAEFNMVEVPTFDLAMDLAAQADENFANGVFLSPIQGIPFAIKDTYDVAGYATAYGSWEFLQNIVQTESPLVTFAVEAGAIPLFKSSVPQLTWGTANFNGTTYSCLNGGYSAGPEGQGGSSIGSATAVCLGVVPVAICEQTGSSCQSPAMANGISTIIPSIGTLSRENNGLISLDTDRPGLHCRDILSCAVFYNYMRGATPGDPMSRDVPFGDPRLEDLSTYTIAFVDNSNDTARFYDTPFYGQRDAVPETLASLGATVNMLDSIGDLLEATQLFTDYRESGVGSASRFDSYYLNVEGIYEGVQMYGGQFAPDGTAAVSYGPVWRGQNFGFLNGSQRGRPGASALAYLEAQWIYGYVSESAMFPMMEEGMPDVVVHFGQSELGGAYTTSLVRRAGVNTIHIPQFYWNNTDETFVGWVGSRPDDHYVGTTVSSAMITCESKKYEPVKAFAVCHALQQALVPGGKLISPNIEAVHEVLKMGMHDLDCPYDWSDKRPGFLDWYPPYLKERVESKLGNIGKVPNCEPEFGVDTRRLNTNGPGMQEEL